MAIEDDLARCKNSFDEANKWRPLLTDAYRYSIPNRERFYEREVGDRGRQAKVYDDTAVIGVQDFASRVQSLLIPPWREWMGLVPGVDVAEDRKDQLAEALEPVNNSLFEFLHQSNLDMVAHESIMDMSVSIGGMLMQEGDESKGQPLFNFTSVPTPMLAPEEGPGGRLDGCWRNVNIAVRNIEQEWPAAEGNLGGQLEKLKASNPSQEVELVEGTFPAPGKEGILWRYVLLHAESKHYLIDGERDNYPWILFRWSKAPGERFGRGPVLSVLPSIMALNKAKEFTLRSAALDLAPVYTARNDGILNPYLVRIVPNTVLPVLSNESSNPSIRLLDRPQMGDFGALTLEDLKNSIRQTLLTQPFGELDSPTKTATEMSLRAQELNQKVGAQFGRLQTELVKPIVANGLRIMAKTGKIAEDVKLDTGLVDIQMKSPLARLQDQEDIGQIAQYLEIVGGALGPEVLQGSADLLEAADEIGTKLGVSRTILRSEDERAEYAEDMKQRTAQAMAQMQMEAQQKEAAANAT